MNSDWMQTRQTKFAAYASVYVLIGIAVFAAINFLANRHNKSWDLTSNKRYSLADQTEKIVKNLKQDVKITYYDNDTSFPRAKDLLDRYSTLSTKLTVEYVNPYKKPLVAKQEGVRTEGTIHVKSGEKKEEARSLTEEEVTGAIIRSIKGGSRMACSVIGSGESGFEDSTRNGLSNAKDALEKNNIKTQTIKLIEKPEVPKECTTLIVAGPKFDYQQPAVDAIKQYVETGGKAMFLVNPPLRLAKDETAENAALVKVLDDWGFTLNKNLVLDTSGVGQLFGLSEAVPLVTTYETHAIVREMKEVATAFPLVRSLDVKAAGKITPEKLLSSSANSVATTNLSSQEIKLGGADKKGPFNLAAAGTYDTGDKNNPGRVVVVGSSGWVSNGLLRFNGNRDLFLNMMNWLSADEDLISIRPKDPEDQRLTMNRNQMTLVFWYSVVAIPFAVVLAGIATWWKRR